MSDIYTRYLNLIPDNGTLPDAGLGQGVLGRITDDLRLQLKKRGLWSQPPSYLGYSGNIWNECLSDLAHDAYLYIFSQRLKNLKPQLRVGKNIDGLVVRNLQYFLTERHRAADPIGYRVFEVLKTTIDRAIESQDLHLLEGDERIRNNTVLGFSAEATIDQVTGLEDLGPIVSNWAGDLLPDLVTARARQVTKVYVILTKHLLGLRDQGIQTFRFQDVANVLKTEIRCQWASVWNQDAGEIGVELDEDGLGELVRVVQPEEYDDGGSFEWLLECVPHSIDQRQDDSEKNRDGLWKIWEYVRASTVDTDPSERRSKMPSNTALGKLLDIYRERVPVLLKVIRGLVELCLDREGEARQTVLRKTVLRKTKPHPIQNPKSRTAKEQRITS